MTHAAQESERKRETGTETENKSRLDVEYLYE